MTRGGAAVEVGQFRVGLYYAAVDPANPNTPPSLAAMTLLNDTGVSPVAGRFLGGTQTTPATTVAGSDAWFAVRAWSTGYASWSAAFGSGSPSVFVSFNDTPFKNVTGGAGNPAGPPQALSGFTGINSVAPVPEPSIIALGVLGAAAFLLRRRK